MFYIILNYLLFSAFHFARVLVICQCYSYLIVLRGLVWRTEAEVEMMNIYSTDRIAVTNISLYLYPIRHEHIEHQISKVFHKCRKVLNNLPCISSLHKTIDNLKIVFLATFQPTLCACYKFPLHYLKLFWHVPISCVQGGGRGLFPVLPIFPSYFQD